MRVRDWAGADYYRELGVAPTATRDEIAVAFRTRARLLHPDAAPADPASEAAFVRAATAYEVLTGPMREEYDRARRRGQVRRAAPGERAPVRAPSVAVASSASEPSGAVIARVWPVTRRGGRAAMWSGIAVMLAGLLAGAVVIALQAREARLRNDGIPTTAVVVRDAGVPRLEFTTRSGTLVRTDLPDAKSGGRSAGDAVEIRYDRDDPERIVSAQRAVGRDITLWIVAAKLLIVGAVLTFVGGRRLLRNDRR